MEECIISYLRDSRRKLDSVRLQELRQLQCELESKVRRENLQEVDRFLFSAMPLKTYDFQTWYLKFRLIDRYLFELRNGSCFSFTITDSFVIGSNIYFSGSLEDFERP